MNQRDIDALVIDFGGVLTTPLYDAMAEFAREVGVDLEELVRVALGLYAGDDDRLVFDLETGAISEDEFARAFAARLEAVSGTRVEPEGLVARMFRVELEMSMLDAVAAARAAGYKTGMLSNSWGPSLYPRDILSSLFDEIVISGEVGLRKPDPLIFELATRRLEVAPSRAVFVDDHPGHLEVARDLGFITVLHRTPAETVGELKRLLALSDSS